MEKPTNVASQKLNKVCQRLGFDPDNFVYTGQENIFVGWVTMTVALAQHILLNHNKHNRKKKIRKIENYARDMAFGNWHITHQSIAFGFDSQLADGQNRLEGVVLSDKPVNFLVAIGVQDKAKMVIDTGCNRTAKDAAGFAGKEDSHFRLVNAKAIEAGILSHNQSFTQMETVQLLDKHKQLLDFIDEQFPKKITGITAAPVMAVIGRAFHAHPEKKNAIIEFCQILNSGNWGGKNSNFLVHKMRDDFIKEKYSGGSEKAVQYAKAEFVLHDFLFNDKKSQRPQNSARLKSAKQEMFPFDWELGEAA